MIPVKVQKITYHPPSRSYAVILKEIDGERQLPVIVGTFEAQSIALAMEYMDTPRPLTHDLIGNILKEIDAKLKAVKITELKDGIFYASLELQGKTMKDKVVDSRPSDALAVALRLEAPILIDLDVMNEAAFMNNGNELEGIQQDPGLDILEDQLHKAIEEEEYERAARLRDKIKDISSN
ncbi:MAG: bifunctional nuclease family protein [Candidatus Marinimicrobia bacterium]|nr:bifunctional nuclease family protein [Candidatus Neomarinimicrobiota bacterium]MBT6369537.1 bifunctional nuclease family protein [Candidatus Neomarinimicrobiota bacterium]